MAIFTTHPHFVKLFKIVQFTSRTFSTFDFSLSSIYRNMPKQALWPPSNNMNLKFAVNSLNKCMFTTSSNVTDNYEGDGKTTVTILNREYKHLIMIDSYSNLGFRLNNGVYALGPIAAFPRTILHWNVNTSEELTSEAFSLFCLLDPKIDILVVGTGSFRVVPKKEVLEDLKSCKISVEILPTDKAVSLFNFLNAEGRYVAGAFIPPASVEPYEDELKLLNISKIEDVTFYPNPKMES